MAEPATGTVTFLFTDIEGSTRLWEEAPEMMGPALSRHDALLRAAIEQCGGRVFKTIGDAFCAAFENVQEAVGAALAAQRAVHREVQQIRVRMALHVGEAEARGGDYFGPALNRTARLLTAAHGGQVLLSEAAAEAIGRTSAGALSLRPLGRHQLRDITEWETIFQLQAPDLPAEFPPPNTIDVAERRGRLRAYSISAVIGIVILGLAGMAIGSAVVARRLAEGRRRALLAVRRERDRAADLLYASQMNLAYLAVRDGKIPYARRLLEDYLPQPGRAPGGPDRRDFAWRFLWRLCRSDDRYVFPPRAGEVNWVDYSPDGSVLAASGDDGSVQLWSVADRELLATLPAHQGASAATFSPDGRLLATVGWEDGTVKLWDLAARRPALRRQWPGFRRQRARALFTPDGKTLIAGFDDSVVRLWDLRSGKQTRGRHRSIAMRAAGIMALLPDGRTLALCGAGKDTGRVTLWNIAGGNVKRLPVSLPPIGGIVESLAFSPDGRVLATGAAGRLILWDVANGRVLRELRGHEAVILGLAMAPARHPRGRRGTHKVDHGQRSWLLASGALDGTVRLWDVGSGRPLAVLQGHMGRVTSVRFSPRGDTLASASRDGTVRLWDTDMDRLRERSRQRGEAEILAEAGGGVGGFAFSADGSLLAVVRSQAISLWNVSRRARMGPPLWRGPGPGAEQIGLRRGCAFTPDGRWLATASRDGSVSLWDVARRREIDTIRGHQATVSNLGFAAGGVLVTVNGGGSTGVEAAARFWDLAAPAGRALLLATLPGDSSLPVAPLAISSDGKIVATSSPEQIVTLWSVPLPGSSTSDGGGQPRWVAALEGRVRLLSLAFSPDGALIAGGSSEGIVYLWDRASGKQLRRLMGQVGPVTSLAFAPDGRTLASGGMDRTVRLWSSMGDQQEAALVGHRSMVWALAFSPDGNLLASGGPD